MYYAFAQVRSAAPLGRSRERVSSRSPPLEGRHRARIVKTRLCLHKTVCLELLSLLRRSGCGFGGHQTYEAGRLNGPAVKAMSDPGRK